MTTLAVQQGTLFPDGQLADRLGLFPSLRFMGSKFRLLSWISQITSELRFGTVLDAFSGSGCVAYLFKSLGKAVTANDAMNFSATIARAIIENREAFITQQELDLLLEYDPRHLRFIQQTFDGIFFTVEDLRFLDQVSWQLQKLGDPYKQALAVSALVRSSIKRQPRGVFTVAGDPDRYKDGRRDLRLSLREHFIEHVEAYNAAVFDNGQANFAVRADVFDLPATGFDLVYLDPPYVPRADDNCYIKRYHFLEGLSLYWKDTEILADSRVKKLKKRFTPFSYRRTAVDAFDRLFRKFRDSTLLLSYSSNGFPDLDVLIEVMRRYKDRVEVHSKDHRYHFGTHDAATRNEVTEHLIVGTS
jgi:DNA adenine methylase/adenine-specific DNA-methyltransferase